MKVHEFRLLIALAEEQHFGRAAERIGIAQPQLSEAIKRIEDEIGVTIFTRRPQVRVTPAGEVMLNAARSIVREVELSAERAKAVAKGLTGQITLGFSPPAMCSDFPKLLHDFVTAHHDVELKLLEGTTGPLRVQLDKGELDLIVSREPVWGEGLETVKVADDAINLLLPEELAPPVGVPVNPADLEGTEFILFQRASAPHYYDRIMAWCREIGLKPKVTTETNSWVAVLSMVAAGLGYSLGTELLSRIAFPGVAYRQLDAMSLDVSFWMSWRPGRCSPASQKLIQYIRARKGGAE